MVESFLNTELETLISEPEELDKWNSLVEELGLPRQSALASKDKSPIPFPQMNASMIRVYSELCPTTIELAKYDSDTIPTRVLELAALCKRENYFREMAVWHSHMKPDPILVGYLKEYYSWSHHGEMFLIARWGDELRSFAELRKLAIESWVEESKAKLREAVALGNMQLESIESLAIKHFNGDLVQLVKLG